jgi:hypothetical protein
VKFITTPEQRAGLLCAVVTGGRPELNRRPVRKFLGTLEALGCQDIVWCVKETDEPIYERDDYPILTYPNEWAYDYARAHCTDVQLDDEKLMKGGLVPAARTWICQEAERRGCWGVLQLDDNIVRLSAPRGGKAAIDMVWERGGMAMFADLIAAVTLATNSRLTGAQLDAVVASQPVVARAGYAYSLFIEQVGPGREDWYGPLENDIIQCLQYGTRQDGATTALMPLLRYMKLPDKVSATGSKKVIDQAERDNHRSGGGMRAIYDNRRAVGLQRMFPQYASIGAMARHSNGRGDPRLFHKLRPLPNKLKVEDQELFGQVKDYFQDYLAEWKDRHRGELEMKVERRGKRLTR